MNSRQNNFYFSDQAQKIFLAFCVSTLSACSIYQSSAREAIQKNTGNIVTSGFMLELNAKYECFRANHPPTLWGNASTPLDEFIESELVEAQLTQTEELPVVLISLKIPSAADFEGCTLHILDSKLSSQRLHDVVAFGEKLLTTSHGQQ